MRTDRPTKGDRLVMKDGTNWVAMCETGRETMQGDPIGPEHLQVVKYLREELPND